MKRGTNLASITLGCLAAVWSMQAIADGGDIKWADNVFTDSVAYHSGRVYGFGSNEAGNEGLVRAYKAKSGRILWERRFEASVAFSPAQITATDELVVVVGAVHDGSGFDWFVAAMDADDGDLEWQKVVPSAGAGFANGVTVLGENIVVVGAEYSTNDFSSPAFFIARGFDADDGDMEWENIDPNAGRSFGDKVVGIARKDDDDDDDDDERDDDGGVAIAYGITNNETNDSDKLIRAYDSESGRILWSTVVDSGGLDDGGDNLVVEDGVVYFTFRSLIDEVGDWTWQARAISAHDGSPIWDAPQGAGFFVDSLAIDNGKLIAVTECVLYRFDTQTGAVIWDTAFPFDLTCPIYLTIERGRAVTSGFDFNFFELAVTGVKVGDGTPDWLTQVPGALPRAFFFGFNTGDSIASGQGLVFVGGTQLTAFKAR